MIQREQLRDFDRPVMTVARPPVGTLRRDLTVQGAIEAFRSWHSEEDILYLYVVDEHDCLCGVLPTRRLLAAMPEQKLAEIAIERVVSISNEATVLEACESFIMYKFLAFPIVDKEKRILGVVDVNVFTDEMFNATERRRTDDLFEALGFHISHVMRANPLRAFRYRFPWLIATLIGGTICALMAGAFAVTLSKAIVLTFFLAMVLGLGEAVSVQSMAVTIQALRSQHPTVRWYVRSALREMCTAALLGAGCGVTVGLVAWLWQGAHMQAVSIGLSLVFSLTASSFFGLSIPALLHALKLDPKVSSGPVALALADICTLFFYLSIAAWLL